MRTAAAIAAATVELASVVGFLIVTVGWLARAAGHF
jgi:hypothetical protein